MNAEPLFNRPVRYPHGGKTGYPGGHGVKPETEVMLSFSIPGPIISRILLTQTPVYTVISILYQQKQLVFHESGSCYGSPLLFGCRGICGIRFQWNVFVPVPLHG